MQVAVAAEPITVAHLVVVAVVAPLLVIPMEAQLIMPLPILAAAVVVKAVRLVPAVQEATAVQVL